MIMAETCDSLVAIISPGPGGWVCDKEPGHKGQHISRDTLDVGCKDENHDHPTSVEIRWPAVKESGLGVAK